MALDRYEDRQDDQEQSEQKLDELDAEEQREKKAQQEKAVSFEHATRDQANAESEHALEEFGDPSERIAQLELEAEEEISDDENLPASSLEERLAKEWIQLDLALIASASTPEEVAVAEEQLTIAISALEEKLAPQHGPEHPPLFDTMVPFSRQQESADSRDMLVDLHTDLRNRRQMNTA